MMVMGRVGRDCAPAIRDTAGTAAAPAARCRNFRRGSFIAPSQRSFCGTSLPVSRKPNVFNVFSDKSVAFAALTGKANIPLSENLQRLCRLGAQVPEVDAPQARIGAGQS